MQHLNVTMLRDHLDDIPTHGLADGFSMRRFGPGDRRTWTTLEQAAEPFIEITEATFPESFGDDPPAMARRSYFLVSPDRQDIGTITAWREPTYRGRRWGRIHWVSIVPEFRRRGLCKPMMTVAMNRLRRLGHRRALLDTHTQRLAAIKVYLDFGFLPDLTPAGARSAWTMVHQSLPHPALAKALNNG